MVRYDVDTSQVERVWKTADTLYQNLGASFNKYQHETAINFLRWSVSLHEVGLQINRRGIQRHSAYIVKSAELPGFSTEEQNLLGTILGSYRKRFQSKNFDDFDILPGQIVLWLVVLLRLAILLNIRRLDNFLPDIEAQFQGTELRLVFPENWLDENTLVLEDLKSESTALASNGIELVWD